MQYSPALCFFFVLWDNPSWIATHTTLIYASTLWCKTELLIHRKQNWKSCNQNCHSYFEVQVSIYMTNQILRLFCTSQQPLVGQGLLIFQTSRPQSERHTTLGRIPLDVWSGRRKHLYLTTHHNQKGQISTPRQDTNQQPQQANGRRSTP
jgi:hypothetical protein